MSWRTVISDIDEPLEAIVDAAEAGRRLDVFVAGAIAPLSRSRAKALIVGGAVSVDDTVVTEPKRTVHADERVMVTVPPPEPAEPAGEPIPLDVIYEDGDLIVIDKPAGLVVHPAAGHASGTLVNALIHHCGDSLSGIGGVQRPGIVHRLDKDTSGLMVVAKTDRAHAGLAEQFADHGRTGPLERTYQALVWGVPDRRQATIDVPIGRATHNREKMEVKRSGGRRAITHTRLLDAFPKSGGAPAASLIACRLETGRTHQIRVHLASTGHPVIGDPVYGSGFASKARTLPEPAQSIVSAFPRQALHASLLGFAHPVTGQPIRFESPPPDDMRRLIDALNAL
ncbi:RluA family pseudouridine synthase [Bauldia sp.]|uniref:RluA family pseudouridine synthase n=1 Tax=Bauldia sp. TaxID=2575872 RepID=UPI003BAAE39E